MVSQTVINYLQTFGGEAIISFDNTELQGFADGFLVIDPPVDTNSIEWWSAYATLTALSADFSKYFTVFNTVTALSSNWSAGYNFYVALTNYLQYFLSTVSNVKAMSSIWEEYPYKHLTNAAQQDTHAKNFAATALAPSDSVSWLLSSNQFSTITLTSSATFHNTDISNKDKGGRYQLIIKQPPINSKDCVFESDYVFSSVGPVSGINREDSGITVLKFTSDGIKLYAQTEFYSLSGLLPYTYFAGAGIVLLPDPTEAVEGDIINPGDGVIVAGAVPYETAIDGSINIV